jgi:hypothetical protein
MTENEEKKVAETPVISFDEAFIMIRQIVLYKFPELDTVVYADCDNVEEEHANSSRQYCHVHHIPNTICCAKAVEALPLRHQLGLLFHEFGHLITGEIDPDTVENLDAEDFDDYVEMTADVAIFDNFALEINYETEDDLEAVEPKDVLALYESKGAYVEQVEKIKEERQKEVNVEVEDMAEEKEMEATEGDSEDLDEEEQEN